MNFVRHVGKIGDRKVAIVFREVPGEPHMALVVHTETLGNDIHDPLISCIESDIGQNSNDLADALNRSYTKSGQIILQKLHAEGMLKKVQTEQVIVTPNPNTRVKLSELNKILDEMQQGEQAVRRLAEMDSQRGMKDVAQVARRMRGEANKDAWVDNIEPLATQTLAATENTVLDDTAIANSLRQQAAAMESQANGLLAEAKRLAAEAAALVPETKVSAIGSSRPASATTARKASSPRAKKVATPQQ